MHCTKTQLHILLLLILGSFYLSSCEKGGEIFNDPVNVFDTDYYEMEFVVEPQDRVGFQIFAEETFTDNTSELLSQIGLNEEQIEEVIIKEAEISFVESDSNFDFNILKYIELTVYTDDLGEMKVAWMNPVPAEQRNSQIRFVGRKHLSLFQRK